MTEPIYNLLALVITNGILGTLLFKSRRRKENAEADEAELNNDIKRTNWMEARIGERDKKVDIIYKELRDEQKAHLETLQKLHEKELECKDLEYDKCYRPMCRKRIPQRDNEKFENENQQTSSADHPEL